ncbi:hypothetical protein [Peribacillus frigoritolerans]|uniref:hypothetical protein n=1 Tax=Peribacillus frigoritolerans TaxID=450367 RepID=UPI00207B03B9|nr:hypothetical protein [Peribacillus frigoritolerans]USK75910.1 hypothetical protein LIT31_04895 [Peribacillus frigoritolerans]
MSLNLIEQYVKRNVSPHDQSPKFQKQVNSYYKNVDVMTPEELRNFREHYDGYNEKLAERLLETIFNNNKKLEPYRQYVSASLILTDKEYTQNSRMGNYSVITLDMITCGLAHDLNRILAETIKSEIFTPEIKRHVRETLDYFANKLLMSRGGNGRYIEIPVLPAYADFDRASMAVLFTSYQEIFLLAHELGHYFIDQNLLHLFQEDTYYKAQLMFQLILISEKKFKVLNDEQKKSLFDEVLADEIAYQIYHETIKDSEKLVYDALFYYLNILLSSQYYIKHLLNQTKHNSYELLSWEVRLKYYNIKFKELDIWGAALNNHILGFVKVIANESYKLRFLYSNQAKHKKQKSEKNKRKAAKKSRKNNRNN